MTKAKHPASRAERRRLNEKRKGRTYKVRKNIETGEKESPVEREELYTHVRNNNEGEPFVLVSLHD